MAFVEKRFQVRTNRIRSYQLVKITISVLLLRFVLLRQHCLPYKSGKRAVFSTFFSSLLFFAHCKRKKEKQLLYTFSLKNYLLSEIYSNTTIDLLINCFHLLQSVHIIVCCVNCVTWPPFWRAKWDTRKLNDERVKERMLLLVQIITTEKRAGRNGPPARLLPKAKPKLNRTCMYAFFVFRGVRVLSLSHTPSTHAKISLQ